MALPARASFDEFADATSPTNLVLEARDLSLTLKGEVELEFHDIEGPGGPGNDSNTDTRTLGTRSPFGEIDTFWLAPRIELSEHFGVNSILEFTMTGSSVRAVWFDLDLAGPKGVRHHAEVGYHTPIVTIDRRTERYPLIASAFWRNPELHVAYEVRFEASREVAFEVGSSLAFMRPLSFIGVQDSSSQPGTINVLAAGNASVFSGNGPVAGGRARLSVYGAFLEGFGFLGQLGAVSGTDILRSGFGAYRDLPGYDPASEERAPYWWAGGRAGLDRTWGDHGVHVLVEVIAAREDLLRRHGGYAQASWAWSPFEQGELFHRFEPLARYEIYRIPAGPTPIGNTGRALRSPAPIDAVAWDHDILTLGLIVRAWKDLVTLRAEYAFIDERNGSPELGLDDVELRNDELVVQAELRF